MQLFGSAINFYGGVGECNHRKFVKDTGLNTQKRIRTFTLQVAQRYYEAMTLCIANKFLDARKNNEDILDELSIDSEPSVERHYTLGGNYKLTYYGLEHSGIFMDISVGCKKEILH
jgi:hypothetical protein